MLDKRLSSNIPKAHGGISSYYITIAIMVILLIINFFLWQLARSRIYNTSQAAFVNKARHVATEATTMINEYEEIAAHGKALFEVNPNLTRSQFETFFKNILDDKNGRNKAISAVLYAENVTNPEAFTANIRADKTHSSQGHQFFSIFPEISSPAVVVNYIYPLEENNDLFGYNIASDTQQAQVFTAARLSRTVRISDIMTFLNKKRITVYQPVIIGKPNNKLIGYIVVLVDPDLFFQQLADLADDDISMKVYKGMLSVHDIKNLDNVIYYSGAIPTTFAENANADAYNTIEHINAGGMPITLTFTSSQNLQLSWAQKTILGILLYGGSATIFVMFGMVSYILFKKNEDQK